jgi:chromosome segregation ATPase
MKGASVSGIYGLEKFSHLEDKIYRTIEQFKRERQEREALEREVLSLRRELSQVADEKERLELQVERLLGERDTIKLKVEAMLDAIAMLDLEPVEAKK